jgi:hypothetical protein
VRKASLLVITWCAGTTLAVVLALQGVALVDSQINDDRSMGALGATRPPAQTAEVASAEPDDSAAQIGSAINPVPTAANPIGEPTTVARVEGQLIISASPPPMTEAPTSPPSAQSAGSVRPPSATAPRTEPTVAQAAPVESTAAPTPTVTDTQPVSSAPAAAEGDEPAPTTTRPRTTGRSSPTTRAAVTTTTRRTTTTARVTTTTRGAATTRPPTTTTTTRDPSTTTTTTTTTATPPPDPGTETATFATTGGTIGVSVTGGEMTLAFVRPRSGYTRDVLVESPQLIDVRFASAEHSIRVVATIDGRGKAVAEQIKES